jgi:ribosomal protein S12 methylthiotransferase accessory factor YcaO
MGTGRDTGERRRAAYTFEEHGRPTARRLLMALDPRLGVLEDLEHLTPRLEGLPAVVRAILPSPDGGPRRQVYGRGATADDALVCAVSVGFERHCADVFVRQGEMAGVSLTTGERVRVDPFLFLDRCGLGCSREMPGAIEHAALEASERRAMASALTSGTFGPRLAEDSAPPDVQRIIEWHRGRACQMTTVLIEREPPVVACIAIPAVDDAAAVIGVAAARTGVAAWRDAAMELHMVFLARARRDGKGELRHGGVPVDGGEVVAIDGAWACTREELQSALSLSRRSIDQSTIAPWSRTIEGIAVELTTAVAAQMDRKVAAVALGESPVLW